MKLWVNPELEKRKKSGKINDLFVLNKILIKFPQNKPPVVQFNDECWLTAYIRKDSNSSFQKYDPIYIYHVGEILDVLPPKIDDKQVAFIFLHIVKKQWRIFCDFSPSYKDCSESEDTWKLGKLIANSLQESLEEQTIMVTSAANKLLNKVGLWAAPALISYPLSKIIKQLSENNETGAIKTLEEFCTFTFLEKLSIEWFDSTVFAKRKKSIQQSLDAHKRQSYALTIPTLLPHIEGIITDWIFTRLSKDQIPWRQESKIKKFQDLILENPTPETYNIIVSSAINFILHGQLSEMYSKSEIR